MRFLLLVPFLLATCGTDALLLDGRYNVDITYLNSDWGIQPGDTSDTEWDIEYNNGTYVITLVGADYEFPGKEEKGKLVFTHYQDMDNSPDDECTDFNQLEFTLNPYESRKEFNGTGHSELHMCNVSPCEIFPLPIPECEPVEARIRESVNLHGKMK